LKAHEQSHGFLWHVMMQRNCVKVRHLFDKEVFGYLESHLKNDLMGLIYEGVERSLTQELGDA